MQFRAIIIASRYTYRAIAQAINLVVFIERTPDGRKVRSVTQVTGRDGDGYRLVEVDPALPKGPPKTGVRALLG